MKLPRIDWKALPLRQAGACVAIGLFGGLVVGWQLWRPQTVTEAPAPEIRQKDSSLVLRRAPDAHARPTAIIPRGGTVERVVRLTVQPGAPVRVAPPVVVEHISAQPTAGDELAKKNAGRGTFDDVLSLPEPAEAQRALLQLLSRDQDAAVAANTSADTRATQEGQRAELRRRLSTAGIAEPEALRILREPASGEAPRRLLEAIGRPVALSRVSSAASQAKDSLICPPVDIELALVRMPDKTRRVVASSPNGKILGGVDIPVESAAPAKVLRWSAGATRDLLSGAWGGVVTRDVAFLRLVAIGEPAQGGRGATGKIGVALRF